MKYSFVFFLAGFIVWIILVSRVVRFKQWSVGTWMQFGIVILAIAKSLHFKYFNYRYKRIENSKKYLHLNSLLESQSAAAPDETYSPKTNQIKTPK